MLLGYWGLFIIDLYTAKVSVAVFSQLNFLLCSIPFSMYDDLSSVFVSMADAASTIPLTSFGSTNKAAFPNTSGSEDELEAITGVPLAIASNGGNQNLHAVMEILVLRTIHIED
jgi:hypothetical protein